MWTMLDGNGRALGTVETPAGLEGEQVGEDFLKGVARYAWPAESTSSPPERNSSKPKLPNVSAVENHLGAVERLDPHHPPPPWVNPRNPKGGFDGSISKLPSRVVIDDEYPAITGYVRNGSDRESIAHHRGSGPPLAIVGEHFQGLWRRKNRLPPIAPNLKCLERTTGPSQEHRTPTSTHRPHIAGLVIKLLPRSRHTVGCASLPQEVDSKDSRGIEARDQRATIDSRGAHDSARHESIGKSKDLHGFGPTYPLHHFFDGRKHKPRLREAIYDHKAIPIDPNGDGVDDLVQEDWRQLSYASRRF